MQTDTHNGEANRYTFTTTLGEQITTWCNFPQKVDKDKKHPASRECEFS